MQSPKLVLPGRTWLQWPLVPLLLFGWSSPGQNGTGYRWNGIEILQSLSNELYACQIWKKEGGRREGGGRKEGGGRRERGGRKGGREEGGRKGGREDGVLMGCDGLVASA